MLSLPRADKPAPLLKVGRNTPLFMLPSTQGGRMGPGALRSRYNMVLTFVGSGVEAEAYLLALQAVYPVILASQARLPAVVSMSLPEAGEVAAKLALQFPLLADPDGETARRMLGSPAAALCVADRYGQVVSLETAPSAGGLPSPGSALEWLDYILMQCSG